MTKANRAIRCWIMPHWRVSESLPSELALFDLVIVDEASQSDLWALPALLRAKKLLIVGDNNLEQIIGLARTSCVCRISVGRLVGITEIGFSRTDGISAAKTALQLRYRLGDLM